MAANESEDPAEDKRMMRALGALTLVIRDHGPKSEPVRDFITKTAQREGMGEKWKTLAFGLLLLTGWQKDRPTLPYRNRRAPPPHR